MLSVPSNVVVYLCTAPTDMRKGFDGLHVLAVQIFERDPLNGHLFLFVNRRRNRLKMLWWDRDGMALYYKRLEAGTYQLPSPTDGRAGIELDGTDLALMLNGIDLHSAKRRKRYARSA